MKKKCLIVSVILLFIGVAIAPSININVVKASNDNDLVEVTTQACGINGFGNTTVKLTRQQYQNLEQYLVDFRARLNQTSTREEAVPIFKEAVVELNKYGLLPRGMSVERAQKLVTCEFQNEKIIRKFQRLNCANDYLIKSNFLCLITGSANNAWFLGIIPLIEFFIIECFIGILPIYFAGFGNIQFGFKTTYPDVPWHFHPSTGWVYTNGLTGIKNWNGTFVGGCGFPLWNLPFIFLEGRCIGAKGFTGIGISNAYDSFGFFIGSALWTRIRSV